MTPFAFNRYEAIANGNPTGASLMCTPCMFLIGGSVSHFVRHQYRSSLLATDDTEALATMEGH